MAIKGGRCFGSQKENQKLEDSRAVGHYWLGG